MNNIDISDFHFVISPNYINIFYFNLLFRLLFILSAILINNTAQDLHIA
jgi:hypothetical protein